jgi:CubicO group peptidase (beta-lactamase class C family)
LASLTKPLVSVLSFVLIEKGLLSLDSVVTDFLPYFKPKAPDGKIYPITIRHLLTHTAGLAYGFNLPNCEPYASAGVSDGLDNVEISLDENMRRLASVPLLFKPGEKWYYSLSVDVLGAVLEKAAGQSLPALVEQYICQPLGLKDTSFLVKNPERLADAYFDNPDGGKACKMVKQTDLPIEGGGLFKLAPSQILNPRAFPSGGGGMAGTAQDYFKFFEAIRQGGEPILQSPHSIACLIRDAVPNLEVTIPGPGYGFGMGFGMVRDLTLANTPRSLGSYEWAGGYGNKAYVDPARDLTVIILTNTTAYGLKQFQIDVTEALYHDLG